MPMIDPTAFFCTRRKMHYATRKDAYVSRCKGCGRDFRNEEKDENGIPVYYAESD